MCPDNKIGKVDILVVSHHGLFQSSSPALVEASAAASGDHEQRRDQGRLHAHLRNLGENARARDAMAASLFQRGRRRA